MKNSIITITLIFLLGFVQKGSAQERKALFSGVSVKKKTSSKRCDTCLVANCFHASSAFSYVITGAGHTPHRFSQLLDTVQHAAVSHEFSSTIHFISQRHIGINFLPNHLMEKGKRLQLYRWFGQENYDDLEYQAFQNRKIIKTWSPLRSLPQDSSHVILGSKDIEDQTIYAPWKHTRFAGSYNLNIKDQLRIIVRNITTKKTVITITIIRAVDKPTDFIYYQMKLKGKELGENLQNILNSASGIPSTTSGKSTNVFEKDFGSIGLLRFPIDDEMELQYSYGKKPFDWRTIKSYGPCGGTFLVLNNKMQEGSSNDIYLRYTSQPETINKITIKVKKRPFEIPWLKLTIGSSILLAITLTGFYIWHKRSQKKLDTLKRKSADTEMRLSLLSGQLNPHFLFNSLNAIQGTIHDGDVKTATTYLSSVARFMRDVMDNSKKEFISLQEELKIEEDYLKLEQQRRRFNYNINIAANLSPKLIEFPPMLLQPILENSIRHAIGQGESNPLITINITAKDDTLMAEILDNGTDGWNPLGTNEGHGLSLTRKRIAVYNEKLGNMPIQIEISNLPGTGTFTTFTFKNWLA